MSRTTGKEMEFLDQGDFYLTNRVDLETQRDVAEGWYG